VLDGDDPPFRVAHAGRLSEICAAMNLEAGDCLNLFYLPTFAKVRRRLFEILFEQAAKVGGGGEAGASSYFSQIVFRFPQQLANTFQSLVLEVIMNARAQPPAKSLLHVRA